jgi:pimeloyl-ACP methyl ester carboxylesterase
VLVNGWTASGLVWPRALIERLEARCRVVRIDNRGTGTARGAPTPFTIATLAGDVRRAIASVGLERPTVVGFSMGGMISQELALRWPAVVGRLVLVGTRPPAPEATAPATGVFQALLAATPNGQTLETTIRQRWTAVTGPAFASTNGALVDEMVDAIIAARTPLAAVASQAQAAAAWHGARRLRHLAVPTTIVHGDADPLVPVRNGMRLAQLIPDATYIELPGVGHLVPYEACDRLASIIENVTLVR